MEGCINFSVGIEAQQAWIPDGEAIFGIQQTLTPFSLCSSVNQDSTDKEHDSYSPLNHAYSNQSTYRDHLYPLALALMMPSISGDEYQSTATIHQSNSDFDP
jgi:hypothetical protein